MTKSGHTRLILPAQPVAGGDPPKLDQIDDVERRNVVGLARQMVAPVALLPEAEAFHVFVAVAKRRVTVRGTLKEQEPTHND